MLESVRTLFRNIHLKNNIHFQTFGEKNLTCLRNVGPSTLIQSRTTMVVKRLFPPTLVREGNRPRLRKKMFYYDLVENTDLRPEPIIDVVLTSYVPGVGNPGDLISVKRSAAYNKLLVTGLADYATQEKIEYSKKLKADMKLQETLMSPSVERTFNYLKQATIFMEMNQFSEWTIEPWHVRANARKAGIHILSDDSIELPSKPIKGPDLDLEGKLFMVTVTINKKFKVKLRCVIHHWSANVAERVPLHPEWWTAPNGYVFPEDEQANKDNTSSTSLS